MIVVQYGLRIDVSVRKTIARTPRHTDGCLATIAHEYEENHEKNAHSAGCNVGDVGQGAVMVQSGDTTVRVDAYGGGVAFG